MTLVAARVEPTTLEVHMIADTYAYGGGLKYANVAKIQRRKLRTKNNGDSGDVLLGYAGEHSVSYIARNVELPKVSAKADPWTVIDGIAKAIQDFGAETTGGLNFHGGTEQKWMVAWNGNLWTFVHYDIIEVVDTMAIGAGEDLALGALSALAGEDPKTALYEAAEIAAKWSDGVTPPFRYEIASPV